MDIQKTNTLLHKLKINQSTNNSLVNNWSIKQWLIALATHSRPNKRGKVFKFKLKNNFKISNYSGCHLMLSLITWWYPLVYEIKMANMATGKHFKLLFCICICGLFACFVKNDSKRSCCISNIPSLGTTLSI